MKKIEIILNIVISLFAIAMGIAMLVTALSYNFYQNKNYSDIIMPTGLMLLFEVLGIAGMIISIKKLKKHNLDQGNLQSKISTKKNKTFKNENTVTGGLTKGKKHPS